MELGPEAHPVGFHIGELLGRIHAAMSARPVAFRTPQVHALLNDDIPSGVPLIVERLRSAAFDAKARGATISIIRSGFLVSAAGKSEIVPWADAECGVLPRSLMRVAPYDSEIYGW